MDTLARRRRSVDFWPGFVDALSALLMVLVFLLLVFAIGQFVLSDAISGRDRTINALNAQIAALADSLSMERSGRARAIAQVQELSASLTARTRERDALAGELAGTAAALDAARETLAHNEEAIARLGADIAALEALKAQLESEIAARLADLETTREQLVAQTELSAKSAAQVELLNRQLAALREQLAQITAALELAESESRSKDLELEELGRRLNLALADRVHELSRYRSEFFGRLRAILGERSDVEIVGDRFVLPTGLLFPTASDELTDEGRDQLEDLATTIQAVAAEIPSDLDWVLRIDGHTDRRPIHTARFPSNWELSTARAVAVVKYLVARGIPAHRLSANGFGAHRPLDPADTEAAYARNRRIEIQLTNR
ncbi:MAG TPA: peptidoglycan -binding protein [Xanthomonadaceae bacterium]|nr:peptidoglycan -binding protein [Xanthomonadaceae bacterium]